MLFLFVDDAAVIFNIKTTDFVGDDLQNPYGYSRPTSEMMRQPYSVKTAKRRVKVSATPMNMANATMYSVIICPLRRPSFPPLLISKPHTSSGVRSTFVRLMRSMASASVRPSGLKHERNRRSGHF